MNRLRHRFSTPLIVITGLLTLVFLAGCNTIRGAGKDIQKAGEKIEDAATK